MTAKRSANRPLPTLSEKSQQSENCGEEKFFTTALATPGPWFAAPAAHPIEGTPPFWYVNTGPDSYDPAVAATWGPSETHEANARLLAAAPELLDALHDLLKATNFDDGEPWIVGAHAAIAKAEGRS
jgi:hypothetical protein